MLLMRGRGDAQILAQSKWAKMRRRVLSSTLKSSESLLKSALMESRLDLFRKAGGRASPVEFIAPPPRAALVVDVEKVLLGSSFRLDFDEWAVTVAEPPPEATPISFFRMDSPLDDVRLAK